MVRSKESATVHSYKKNCTVGHLFVNVGKKRKKKD